MDTIPFKPHDPDAMLTETEGLVQLYDDELVLQLETKDAFFGRFKRSFEVRLPLDEISSVEFKAGWFRTQITVQAHSVQAVTDVPGSRLGSIRLRFRRKYREEAAQLAEMIEDSVHDLRIGLEYDDELGRLTDS
ncbi:MAG: hypothetical protein O7I93_13620 [Gemmatimonadetes bacterium]|nr:hypothetical protein [Gemmatimonadota bacterium]